MLATYICIRENIPPSREELVTLVIVLVQNLQHSIVEPLPYGVNTMEVTVIWVHSVGQQHCDNAISRVCTHQGPSVAKVDTNKSNTNYIPLTNLLE